VTDTVFTEIVREYFETVAAEMNAVLDRTALSPVFNEAHDCSAGLFFLDERRASIIARAQAEPVHIYASLYSVQGLVDYFRSDLHAGDVGIVNDPYMYGTHSADWTIMKPVFHGGKPVFFPAVRGHMEEHGCPFPGGVSPSFRDIWQESIRFAPLKLYARGELQRDVLEWLRANNRQPDVMTGDLNAMVGACAVAERRIVEILEKYGFERVLDGVRSVLDYSERRVRSTIRRWPDGDYTGRSVADSDFAGNRDLGIECTIRVRGDELEADFTGSHEQVTGHVNSTFGSTASWVYTALSAVMCDIPINSGFFRPVALTIPEGTIVNPVSPAPVCTNTILIGSTIGDAVMKALEQIVPQSVGSVACDVMITMHFGHDERFPDRPYFVHGDYLMSAVMSSGAYGVDGWGAWSAPHGSHRMPTVEMTEVQTPILYLQAEYAADTAAPGQWRGTPAFHVRRQHPPGQAITYTLEVQSSRHPLPGWVGGAPGASTYVVLDEGGPREQTVRENVFHYEAQPLEVMFVQKGAGGGWGQPLDRDPERVLADVVDGYVSVEAARADYGVVIDEARMLVDADATTERRSRMRRNLATTGAECSDTADADPRSGRSAGGTDGAAAGPLPRRSEE
jgi:N-methylhydantoinase B